LGIGIPKRNARQVLMLRAESMGIMRTWVDVSYAVHKGMKSHKEASYYLVKEPS
jgi:hypothetical protein